ncbi:helix-turn-helix domain-containing protein [Streptomyces sp. NPDC057136]|uniref:helix-turn-helix domain-containing protein n=1 Tax=Streptomyces sp. NPDC057136 TaxID=3346029 RepID=UPI0036423627
MRNERFSALLRALKERSGLSYEGLAGRAGIGRSTLHRYCAGASVPVGFGVAHELAKVCGASAQELRELHKLWALADACRAERGPTAVTGPPSDAAQATQAVQVVQAAPAAAVAASAPAGPGRARGVRRAWPYGLWHSRRGRRVLLIVLSLAVLAGTAPLLIQAVPAFSAGQEPGAARAGYCSPRGATAR